MHTQNQSESIAATIAAVLFPLASGDDAVLTLPRFKFIAALTDAAEAGAVRTKPARTARARLLDCQYQISFNEELLDLVAVAPPNLLTGPVEIVRSQMEEIAKAVREIACDAVAPDAAEKLGEIEISVLEAAAVAGLIGEGLQQPPDENAGSRGAARLLARRVEEIYGQIDHVVGLLPGDDVDDHTGEQR